MFHIAESLPLLLLLYVASGVLQPIVLEILNYNGFCEHSTMLFLLPTYLGMSLTYFLPSSTTISKSSSGITKNNIHAVSILCALDVLSQTLNLTGLVYAGSMLFTILYSSCTIWTAVFSYYILKRSLHPMQSVSVVVIVLGLTVASAGSMSEGKNVIFGGILILLGSTFHSLVYIISEKLMIQSIDPIAPENLSFIMGFFGLSFYSMWQILYTIPNFQTLIVDQIIVHNGSVRAIFLSYIGLIIINFVHAFCFFHLLGQIGATTTGVLKGVQTVIVFIVSHLAFCSLQYSQCFTFQKGISVVVVVAGVMGYSYFNTGAHHGIAVGSSTSFTVSPSNSIDIDSSFPYIRVP